MKCSNCYYRLEDDFCYCPRCSYEVDKAGGIDDPTLQKILDARQKTLDVLKRIIDDLEKYGKVDAYSSLVSSGANIASALLWLTVPGKPVAAVGDMIASGLGIANCGVSLFTTWKENGLLNEANKVCQLDHLNMKKIRMALPAIKECISQYHDSPKVLRSKMVALRKGYKSSNYQDYESKFKPTDKAATVSLLENFTMFINRAVQLHKGNYSLIADMLKKEVGKLKNEYEHLKSAPPDCRNITLC